MNYKRIIPVILVLFQSITLFGQKVEFTYDDNGNRLSRTITVDQPTVPHDPPPIDPPPRNGGSSRTILVDQLKSNTVQFLVFNPKSLESTESMKSIVSDEEEKGEIITLVYPNPNKGLIKIDISNLPLESKNEMRLYDLSGIELIVKRNFDSYSEIDISQFKDGIYILRIKINDKVFDWKVIKSHN